MSLSKTPFFVGTYQPESAYNIRRYNHTLDFIKHLHGEVLDCAEPNFLKTLIEEKFKIKIKSTIGDLDISPLEGKYDFVFAFEIIEHLMNPLWFLTQIRKALNPDGSLYLSTSINKPNFFWRHDHFHEFDEYRLKFLLDKTEILRKERKRSYSITGIRPVIRLLLKTGTMFMELKPKG